MKQEHGSSESRSMVRRLLLRSIGIGFGAVLAIAGILGVVTWQAQRPKPWDKAAITATFDRVGAEGDKDTLTFLYMVENHTDRDYRVSAGPGVTVGIRLKRQGGFSPVSETEFLKAELPLFVPAREKILYRVHVGIPYEGPPLPDAKTAKKEHDSAVAAFVRKEMANTDGFVLLDESARYHIIFPAGW